MTRLDSADLYSIGWISALHFERAAATALLDERHEPPAAFQQHPSDPNSYTWGRIGEHNVVIASLPAGRIGEASAATTASSLLSSLPQIRIGLLVGIGSGIARPEQDIRLGDVVVSQPDGPFGGVVQYDLGSSLNSPPRVLLHALASLKAEHEIAPSKVPSLLQAMLTANPRMMTKSAFVYQGAGLDRLFRPTYRHAGGNTCAACDASQEVEREPRDTTDPEIHYGIIASGNTLIEDAATRDVIANAQSTECICFEMEAAGLLNHFPCLVIRGICDYADSHKGYQWQRYAAATAAAYAKELLGYVPVSHLHATQPAIKAIESS